jgi:predicted RNase H-like nuclease
MPSVASGRSACDTCEQPLVITNSTGACHPNAHPRPRARRGIGSGCRPAGQTPSSEAGMGFVMLPQLAAMSRTPNLAAPLHLAIRQSGQDAIKAPEASPR